MQTDYLVFSADWQSMVKADDSYDAVMKATKLNFDKFGQLFNISKTVVAVKAKGDLKSFDSIAVLEDLGFYHLSKQVRIYLKNIS
jgi:hypothetical protein